MTKFLSIKHWQLFGLLVGLPMIFQFVSMASVISTNDPFAEFKYLPIMLILYIGIFLGWFYSLGINLHKKLPKTVTMNLKTFKLFLLIPAIYSLFFLFYVTSKFSNVLTDLTPNLAILEIIFPLHFFSMFCIFYCLYFISKELKAVEWQKPVTFSDFAGEFFLIWFFPLGVWVIQPRINKIFESHADNKLDNESPTR